jgi:hypothetical protein
MRGRPILRTSNVSAHFGQVLVAVAVLANRRPTLRLFLAKVWGMGLMDVTQKTTTRDAGTVTFSRGKLARCEIAPL